LCYEEAFLAVEEGLIIFLYRCVGNGVVENGVTDMFMEGFALIVPLVHGTGIGLRGVGGELVV
jgi:hypothetical protein